MIDWVCEEHYCDITETPVLSVGPSARVLHGLGAGAFLGVKYEAKKPWPLPRGRSLYLMDGRGFKMWCFLRDYLRKEARQWVDTTKVDDGIFTQFVRVSANYLRIIAKCESPVERILLLEMIHRFQLAAEDPLSEFQEYTDCLSSEFNSALQRGEKIDLPELFVERQCGINITPQLRVPCETGTPRVDFGLDCTYDIDPADGEWKTLRYAVEVDGHEFHEKTKEQAQRDKRRDRMLVKAGFTALHFTGSEVYRSPKKVVDEIVESLMAGMG